MRSEDRPFDDPTPVHLPVERCGRCAALIARVDAVRHRLWHKRSEK